MARVIQLHLWMQNKKETWHEKEVMNQFGDYQRGRRVILDVGVNASIAEMKVAVANELKKHMRSLKYYYVVAVMERDEEPRKRGKKGKSNIGYRTIVPKVVLA
jgi:hypothetical protein